MEPVKNYDLLSVLLICPGKPDSQDSEGILRLLGVLLSSEIKSNDKKKLLEQEFQIEMNWSVQDAMDALKINEQGRPEYIELLKNEEQNN